MSRLTFFVATCRSCDQKIQLELQKLGHQVSCRACGKQFRATGADSASAALEDPVHFWINFTAHSILDVDLKYNDEKDIGRTPR